MLPYFRKTEHHHDPGANPKEHGLDGGMYTYSNTSTGRKYPLRHMVKAAWESIGLKEVPDANSGVRHKVSTKLLRIDEMG